MNSNLVHSASEWFAEDDTRLSIVSQALEVGRAILALWRDFAHADLVAHHLDGLFAFDVAAAKERKFSNARQTTVEVNSLWEFSLDTANVLLLHLSISDLMLHLSRFLRTTSEQQQARRQPIQSMYRPQVLQIVFFGENKDHCVVTITAARMNL